MRIGELAGRLGLNPKTLRYWEQVGILPEPARDTSGYRDYTENHLKICEFILKAKSLGLSLREIKDILDLAISGETPCECVKEKIKQRIENIDLLVERLKSEREKLEGLLNQTPQRENANICPIIDSVELKGSLD